MVRQTSSGTNFLVRQTPCFMKWLDKSCGETVGQTYTLFVSCQKDPIFTLAKIIQIFT